MARALAVLMTLMVLAGASLTGALADARGLFVVDFAADNDRPLHAPEGYTPYTSGFFTGPEGGGLTGLTVTIRVRAASPDGCTLGAALLLYDAARQKLGTVQPLWNRDLTADFADHEADVTIGLEGVACARLVLYRANQTGTLIVQSAEVAPAEVVPAEELVAGLRAELETEGWATAIEGESLVARQPDARAYYRTFPGEQLKPDDFRARSYVGTTYVRREFEPPRFPIGPYIYGQPDDLRAQAEAAGLSLEQLIEGWAADIAAHGGNTVYYANLTTEPEVFRIAVETAARHGVAVFGQLTGDLYLRPERGPEYYEQVTLPTARAIMPQYRDLPNLLGWMGKEEASEEQMPLVAQYRAVIRELDPTHAQFTLHNQLAPFRAEREPLPEWFGFDRYRFRCLKAHYGLLISTPRDMAIRLREELHSIYPEAAQRGRPLIYVMQGYGHENLFTTADIRAWSGGQRDTLDPWGGFREVEPGVWRGWDRYPPPPGGMHLQSWLAVSEGAQGLLIYHYQRLQTEAGLRYVALVDPDGQETRLWREFAECMAEMRPLLPLFLSWHKEAMPRATVSEEWVKVSSFIREFDAERYLVVVNERIATWDTDSPALPRGKTELHFDDQGLAGLHEAEPLTCALTVEGDEPVFNLRTGERLTPTADGSYELTVGPGRGTVLMQGPPETMAALRAELGLVD